MHTTVKNHIQNGQKAHLYIEFFFFFTLFITYNTLQCKNKQKKQKFKGRNEDTKKKLTRIHYE